jgi:hypothetical protein
MPRQTASAKPSSNAAATSAAGQQAVKQIFLSLLNNSQLSAVAVSKQATGNNTQTQLGSSTPQSTKVRADAEAELKRMTLQSKLAPKSDNAPQ